MYLTLMDVIILFTIMQLAALGLFCVAQGVLRRKGIVFLGLAFISFALNIGSGFVDRQYTFFYCVFVHAFWVGEPFAFLYAPAIYLYARDILKPGRSRPLKTALHLLPAVVFVAYLFFAYHARDDLAMRELLSFNAVLPPIFVTIVTVLLQVQVLVYVLLVVRLLLAARKELRARFSATGRNNALWILKLMAGFVPLWFIDLLRFLGGFTDPELGLAQTIEFLLYFVFIVFCFFIFFNAMRQPRMVFASVDDGERPAKKNLSERTRDEYAARLAAVMKEKKPYLEPELSLAELAEITGIPARSLSEVIHASGLDNFYDFINDYRVREFLDLAARPGRKGRTVLELLFEAGFNSKSVFNKVFKKKTGENPSSFLRRQAIDRVIRWPGP